LSGKNTVLNNSIRSNEGGGIRVELSSQNTFRNNTFQQDGINIIGKELTDFIQLIPKNNTVNGKPIYYYLNETNLNIDGLEAGQIILVNCKDSSIKNLNVSDTDVGLRLAFSNNNQIKDCKFSNDLLGIALFSSDKNNILGNKIYSNKRFGIALYLLAKDNLLSKNEIHSNGEDGILLHSWTEEIPINNTILANEIYSNGESGIELDPGMNNIISANRIYKNEEFGINLYSSTNNTIFCNDLIKNTNYGVYISHASALNKIHHNNFIKNCKKGPQACDNDKNFWMALTEPYEGNHWSDWRFPDRNKDGIVDFPYKLDGKAHTKDYRPLIRKVRD
jgi:parallel beta-helix repeat protein